MRSERQNTENPHIENPHTNIHMIRGSATEEKGTLAMDLKRRYEAYAQIVLTEHEKVFHAQDTDELEKMLKVIMAAKRIFVTGAGREGIAARSFAMRLMHLGFEVHWIWDDTTPGMKEGDLFLLVNGSGKIGHIDYLAEAGSKTGAAIAMITGAPREKTPGEADCTLFVPACVYKGTDERAVPSVQPMGNLFEQHLFLLFDVMVMLLREEMDLTYEEMENRHRNIE